MGCRGSKASPGERSRSFVGETRCSWWSETGSGNGSVRFAKKPCCNWLARSSSADCSSESPKTSCCTRWSEAGGSKVISSSQDVRADSTRRERSGSVQVLRNGSRTGDSSVGTGKRSCRKVEVRNLASRLELEIELCKRCQRGPAARGEFGEDGPRHWYLLRCVRKGK